jgi:hypothetical protein
VRQPPVHAGFPGLSFSSSYSVMPLLSTMILPKPGWVTRAMVEAPPLAAVVLGAGPAVVVVVGGLVLELAGLLLLEHAASANAATAATAKNRIRDVRMRTSPGWASPTTTDGAVVRFR